MTCNAVPLAGRSGYGSKYRRHVTWELESPDREVKQRSRWGWIFYRRVKTGKTFYRPMNRTVHAHIESITPDTPKTQAGP